MEPKQQAPGASYDAMPMPPVGGETYAMPEVYTGAANERRPEVVQGAPAPAENSTLPPVLPAIPMPIAPVADDAVATTVASDDNPITAADDDLIEKEWVDKAKKIIEQTKDDPYKRELEIGNLQRDYIKKRYGREIGAQDN